MEIIMHIVLSIAAGVILGVFFFGGLWKTVNLIEDIKRPMLWMAGSFIIRSAVVMIGLYVLLQMHWLNMAVALIGFFMTRIILVRKYREAPELKIDAEI